MPKVPVLFIVFNRPDKTRQVLEQIAIYKPEKLYVAADGPRRNIPTDSLKCQLVRDTIEKLITWPCELKTLFNVENKGSRTAPGNAINWFFEHEPFGIVLEDDCLPDSSFFDYAAEMLVRYEHDDSVFSIAGSNFGYDCKSDDSYFACRYFNMWGWASWRRVAQKIDYNLAEWKSKSKFNKFSFLIKSISYKHRDLDWGWILFWEQIFNSVSENRLKTCWDYQWFYFQFKFSGITIFPCSNLVKNIGFDLQATHTLSNERVDGIPLKKLTFPLTHPDQLKPDIEFEERFIKLKWAFYRRLSLYWHLKHTIYQVLFKRK